MMPARATTSRGAKPPAARKASARAAAKHDAQASQAVAALQLLGRWQRVCSGHLSFSNGCACGVGATVDLSDLDDLIIDYLQRRFEKVPAVARYVATHDVPGGMKSLLRALATGGNALSTAQARDLMAAIDASVVSIEEQHRA